MQPLCKAYGDSSKKLKIELPYNPATLLLGIYPKELKAESHREIDILTLGDCILGFRAQGPSRKGRWLQTGWRASSLGGWGSNSRGLAGVPSAVLPPVHHRNSDVSVSLHQPVDEQLINTSARRTALSPRLHAGQALCIFLGLLLI